MKLFSMLPLGSIMLVACGSGSAAPPPSPPSTTQQDVVAKAPAGQPEGAPEGATPPDGQKLCTCKLAPTEACTPNCAPHRWFAADCDKQRPRACLKD